MGGVTSDHWMEWVRLPLTFGGVGEVTSGDLASTIIDVRVCVCAYNIYIYSSWIMVLILNELTFHFLLLLVHVW